MTRCVLALLVALLAGCAGPKIAVPAGFATVESETYRQRLISPSGTVIGVRRFSNPDPATSLDYWTAALEYQKTKQEGMRLTARDPLTSTSGRDGVLFAFEIGDGSAKVAYLVAVFVAGDSIWTVEVGGKPDAIATDREKIVAAIRTIG